jgi:predicted AAA+ superfamily ATPase
MHRILQPILSDLLKTKSLLLLGPRQVGKSTLLKEFKWDLHINLANEARFALSGSSARKLMRGQANLLPGRIIYERLGPLSYWEIAKAENRFDLKKALLTGLLPEVYLSKIGPQILQTYADVYLKEEIQAEALLKDLGAYARFLELAAELSGQYLNYAKLALSTEINKETLRRFFSILEETLIINRLPSYNVKDSHRKVRQKTNFIFLIMEFVMPFCKKPKIDLQKQNWDHFLRPLFLIIFCSASDISKNPGGFQPIEMIAV